MTDCPEFVRWPGLLGEDLPSPERERYERHLEQCPLCQDWLDRCDECEETWRSLARQIGDPTATPLDPTLTRVIERWRREGEAPSEPGVARSAGASPSQNGQADLYFLRRSEKADILGTLGAYEVQEVIGQGGMGVVLKAYEPALHRLVAIKVLAAAVAGSNTARRRFTREAQAAAAVCHDNIVPVHGVHETDGLPYLVMQYVAGESLQGRLDRTGPLEVTEIVRIAHQTAAGLAAAHAQGLIHRDIKPANLLLENGLARVKITDFGLARMTDDVGLTQVGTVAGTPEYMAPEQSRGEPVDHRADLFSLGSVMYAMCTGRPPFRAVSAIAVLRQVSDGEPAPVRSVNRDVPEWLAEFVARLMAKEPAERFQTAAEVATLLEGYLAHLRQPAAVPFPALPLSATAVRAGAPARELSLAGARARTNVPTVRRLVLAAAGLAVIAVGVLRFASGGAAPKPAADAPAPAFDAWSVTTSQDGKVIAAGGGMWEAPGEIGIWDGVTFKPLQRFAEGRGIASVALSPDGKLIASGGWDGHVRIRDWSAGNQLADFEIGSTARVAFSPNGDLLATASEGQAMQLWDVANGLPVADLDGDLFRFHCVTFSPDGKRVLAGGGDWKKGGIAQVDVWDVATKKQIQTLKGHTMPVVAIAFSHDGKMIATASLDLTVRLWDAESGRWLKTLTGHTGWVEGVAFSPDDKTLISGGHDQTVRFWDVKKGTEVSKISSPTTIRALHLSADGTKLFVGGSQKLLLVVDGASHQQLAALWNTLPGSATAVAMDALPPAGPSKGHGKGWVTGSLVSGLVVVIAVGAWLAARRRRGDEATPIVEPTNPTVKTLPKSTGHSRRHLWTAAILAVVSLSILGALYSRGMLFGRSSGEFSHDFRGGSMPRGTTTFGPLEKDYVKEEAEGLRITLPRERADYKVPGLSIPVSLSGDFEVTLAFETLQFDEPAPGAPSYGTGVLLSINETARVGRLVRSNGSQVVTWDRWATVDGERTFMSGAAKGTGKAGRLRLKRTGTTLHFLWAPGAADEGFKEAYKCDFGSDDVSQLRVEVCGDVGGQPGAIDVRLLRLDAKSMAAPADAAIVGGRRLHGHTGPVHNIRLLPKDRLISGSGYPDGDRTLRLWEVAGGRELKRLDLPAQVQALEVSPDFRFALVGMGNGVLAYVDIESFQTVNLLRGHRSVVGWVGFAPDGQTAVSASSDGTARIWNLADGTELKRFTVVNQRARGVAFFPDGKRLLTADGGGLLQIWDVATGQEVKRIAGNNWVNSVAVLPDGKEVMVTGVVGARLIDLDSERQVRTYREDKEQVHEAAVSPDGRWLLTASWDGKARIWDYPTGQFIRVLGTHDGAAFSAAFSPDGRWAATSGDGKEIEKKMVPANDHDIRVWDLAGGVANAPLIGVSGEANDASQAVHRPWLTAAGGIMLLIAMAFAAVWYVGRNGRRSSPDAVVAEPSPSPKPLAEKQPIRRPPAWALAALPGIIGCGLLLTALKSPLAADGEIHQDFRGGRSPAAPFNLVGPDVDTVARPEDGGLHITLPAGRPPNRRQAVGVQVHPNFIGDFEVTGTYELLSAERPSTGFGIGANLMIATGTDLAKKVTFGRFNKPAEGNIYMTDFSINGSDKDYLSKVEPTEVKSGRLRLVREGSVVRYYVADSPDGEFRQVFECPFGTDAVDLVRFVVNSGTSPTAVDARLLDFTIRTGRSNTAGQSAKTWLIGLGVLGLLTTGASGGWLLRRRWRPPPSVANEPATSTNGLVAPMLIIVKCPGCGRGLKAKLEIAGKSAKCPQCGHAVPVPGVDVASDS